MIVQIARQALRLADVNDITLLAVRFKEIILQLESEGIDPKTHPITRYIALRIRNVACPGIQDSNIYDQKRCVEYLAELNESETGIRSLAGV